MKKVLIFALRRSGGSYVSQILSGGMPILSEPHLPDDGFKSTLTENVKRLFDFQAKAPTYQVVKVCDFEPYFDLLKDRGLGLPDGMRVICLFRHPVRQITSSLFTFRNWEDSWAPREYFWAEIEAYRKHVRLCREINLRFLPKVEFVRYEDTLGDKLPSFLRMVYGDDAVDFEAYAMESSKKHYPLGPKPEGDTWQPSAKVLLKKEGLWIQERLREEMEFLGYAG
jgi:hypothetical protein